MNNYATITIDGATVGLTFGMIAAEEFYKIITQRGDTPENSIGTLQSGDVIYAGACNEALLARKPRPDYRRIIEWVEEAYSDESGTLLAELTKALEAFNDSRFSKNLNNTTETLKKKIAEIESQPK